jgi:hypothetical protein
VFNEYVYVAYDLNETNLGNCTELQKRPNQANEKKQPKQFPMFGALVVDGASGKDVKHAVVKRMQPQGEPSELDKLFQQNPIIIVDIPRSASYIALRCELYGTIDDIQSDFHSTKYIFDRY